MKKIKQLTFVLFIFSVLAFSYPVSPLFAQGGQCDSNPACNPASGTCCGQCDSNPACNPNDPNGIPCCSLEGNNNQHQDPMNHDMDDDDHDNDEINHDRRNNRRHKINMEREKRRGELREKLNECLERERNSNQPPQRSTQHTPAPNCSGSVQQATSANQALDEICISLNDRINRLRARVAALPLSSDQNTRNLQQAVQLAQNNTIQSFQEEVFDQHCPNSGEQ